LSRIKARFAALQTEGRGALIPFLEAYDPDPATSMAILRGMPGAGADLIEIGMPFTDPMADGPTIQAAGLRGLKAGATMARTLAMVREFRSGDTDTPIILMGYLNPIASYGPERFCTDAAAAGVDGLIVVDLPTEEADLLAGHAAAQAIEPGLSGQVRLAGHCPVDGFADATKTGLAYRAALAEAGVDLREHLPALGIARTGTGFLVHTAEGTFEAQRVVLAGGVWLEPMLRWFGINLPIRVLVNQVAVTGRIAPVMRTVVGIASGLLSLKQYPHGAVVIGGGWQGRGDRTRGGAELLPENLIGNLRLACHAIPALSGAHMLRAWAGLEAETADAMPAVGPIPGVANAYVCGSVHSGYTSGPYIAALLAEHILGRTPALPLFPIDRLLPA